MAGRETLVALCTVLMTLLLSACVRGNTVEITESSQPDVLWLMGVRAYQGENGEPDPAEAARYYEQAAKLGSGEAKLALSFLYKSGTGVPQNLDRATQLWNDALATLRTRANKEELRRDADYIAWLIESHMGFPVPRGAVRAWLMLATESWFGPDVTKMARVLAERAHAHGVGTDGWARSEDLANFFYREVEKLYRRAAHGGNPDAQEALARRYYLGLEHTSDWPVRGHPNPDFVRHATIDLQVAKSGRHATLNSPFQNYEKAFYWFEQAAKNGNAISANLALGFLYRDGLGISKSDSNAKSLWNLAFEAFCKELQLDGGLESKIAVYLGKELHNGYPYVPNLEREWWQRGQICLPQKTFKLAPS